MNCYVALALSALLLTTPAMPAPRQAPTTLNGHRVVSDGSGKLLSWVSPQEDAYDRVMALAWSFLLTGVPTGPGGLKIYYSYSYADPKSLAPADWPHNPAGTYAMLAESAQAYYAYSGNPAVIELARQLLDHQLAHGMTPTDWAWANVPFASGDAGSIEYRGARFGDADGRGDGAGVIEPDKVGELGVAFLRFYELTGDARYRDAAISAADALARHVRPGDARRSPWPFRVYAQNNVVREEYTAHVIAPIKLFDGLIRSNLGDVAGYQAARQTAWAWLMSYPMRTNAWANYFEDVASQAGPTNLNQLVALETARYLLQNPEADPNWRSHVPSIIGWVERTFAQEQYGASAIGEQVVYQHVMGSHTSRYASINALWYELTGDVAAREKAFRALNWATYMTGPDGRVIVGPTVDQIWWTDGYGDYLRHFMATLGSVPEWSPPGQDHLLRSSSVVRTASYAPGEVAYETAGGATEVLRLSFRPTSVSSNGQPLAERTDLTEPGWTFDGALGVLRVRHEDAAQIRVTGPPPVGIGAPRTSQPTARAADAGSAATAPSPASAAMPDEGAASAGGSVDTVGFDDRPGENQTLDGQYPAGVIDWGAGAWWHSGPWKGLATKSVSFNGGGITKATFNFVIPRRLVRLDAYNGGASSSTVTLSCAGQPDKQALLVPEQRTMINTGWTGTCATVTISSTNGWDTNFDNLVHDGG